MGGEGGKGGKEGKREGGTTSLLLLGGSFVSFLFFRIRIRLITFLFPFFFHLSPLLAGLSAARLLSERRCDSLPVVLRHAAALVDVAPLRRLFPRLQRSYIRPRPEGSRRPPPQGASGVAAFRFNSTD